MELSSPSSGETVSSLEVGWRGGRWSLEQGEGALVGGYGARLVEKGQFSAAELTKGPCCE